MKNYTIEVGPEQPNGGRIRRSVMAAEGIQRIPAPGVHTLYDLLQRSARKYSNNNALGYRTLEAMIEEEKEVIKVIDGVETTVVKKWSYFQMSGYQYITYAEAGQMALDIGAGFRHLGLLETAKVEIFAPTK
jgi:long-chain acyl-CoA synthetase